MLRVYGVRACAPLLGEASDRRGWGWVGVGDAEYLFVQTPYYTILKAKIYFNLVATVSVFCFYEPSDSWFLLLIDHSSVLVLHFNQL